MRTYTRDEVQAVVQGIAAEGTWLESFEEGAHEVLRRLDALPDATHAAPINLAARRTPAEERAEGGLLVNLDGLPSTCTDPKCQENAHGFEMGQLCGRLLASPEKWSGTYRTANLPGLQRIAEGLGYAWETGLSPDPSWTYVSLIRVEVPRLAVVPATPPVGPESTPPSGPGGGENPKAVNREAFDKVYGEAARKWDAVFDKHEARVRSNPPAAPESSTASILDALTLLGRALRSNSGGIHTMVTLEVSGDHFDAVYRGLVNHPYSIAGERIHCETGEVPVRIVRAQRPREPTPVPSVPALTHLWGCTRATLPDDGRLVWVCDYGCPTRRAAKSAPEVPALKANRYCPLCGVECGSCGHEPPSAPTAPEVVWGTEWVRVMGPPGEERAEVRVHGEWTRYNDPHIIAMARALAEAKREQRIAQVKADASYSKGQEDGAESMRERAAAESERLGRQWGILRSMKMTEHANAATKVAAAIRALSLESEGEVPSTPKAELRAYPRLVDAVRTALAQLRDGPVGRVGDAITTLSDALEGRR